MRFVDAIFLEKKLRCDFDYDATRLPFLLCAKAYTSRLLGERMGDLIDSGFKPHSAPGADVIVNERCPVI